MKLKRDYTQNVELDSVSTNHACMSINTLSKIQLKRIVKER